MFGIDISNIQRSIDLEKGKHLFNFAILKASEGQTLKDKSINKFSKQLLDMEKLIGCYHFCRPDINKSPDGEVLNFLETVENAGLLGNCILVADFETATLGNEEWIQDFCYQIMEITGIVPFIYGSAGVLSRIQDIVNDKIPLWVAQWPNTIRYQVGSGPEKLVPNVKYPWKIWQYSSIGIFPGYNGKIDLDFTLMQKADWVKYSGSKKEYISEDMEWAIKNGLFIGYKDGKYHPYDYITRAQLATVLARYTKRYFQG